VSCEDHSELRTQNSELRTQNFLAARVWAILFQSPPQLRDLE